MNTLRPTLWRTCRIIACESRLKLLWAVFDEKKRCVAELARCVGMGEAQASIQLRALNARGLISSRQERMKVFYESKANPAVDFAPELLEGLRRSYERSMSFKAIIRQATAFTNQRRIDLVQALDGAEMDWEKLQQSTGMSDPSLFLHLRKLMDRGFAAKTPKGYRLARPGNRFGRLLLRIALS